MGPVAYASDSSLGVPDPGPHAIALQFSRSRHKNLGLPGYTSSLTVAIGLWS